MPKKTIKDEVIDNLRAIPAFRERKNKNRYIALMLEAKYYLHLSPGIAAIEAAIADAATYDRAWRQALQEDKSLRGSDYNAKDALEQEAQINLGYTPGYDADMRKLKTVTKFDI